MSLYGALFSGVSGLNAQGSSIAALGDNISNINTVGYKAAAVNFATLVTESGSTTSYSSGGVSGSTRRLIDQQGLIQGTGVVTDVAISGEGFFTVNSKPDGSGEFLYTRAGSFRKDSRGNFVNAAGFNLMAWQLDNEGRLPGQTGNLDTTSSALLDSLTPVNIKAVSGVASATTRVDVGVNLKSTQTILEGAGDTILPPTSSAENNDIAASDIIVPNGIAPLQLSEGNTLSITPSTPGTTYTYTYGGFVASADITANNVFNAATPSAVFSVLPVIGGAASGSSFTVTTETSGTVTFTFTPNAPNVTLGQFNSLNTMADAINEVNGLTARVVNNKLYIAPINATEAITFQDITGTFVSALGGTVSAGTQAAANRFATLQGLSNLIDESSGLDSSVANPLSSSSVKFYGTNPLGTVSVVASKIAILGTDAMTSGAAGSTTINVRHQGHGLATGEFVNFTNVAVFDGLTVADGNYQVTVVDEDNYTITASAGTATAGATAGGGSAITTNPGLANNPFDTTNGSSTVTVHHQAHGLTTADSVTIAGMAAFNGVDVNGVFTITVIDADTYTITASTPATATGAGGGAVSTVETGMKVLKELGLDTAGMSPNGTALGPAYDPTDGVTIPNMATNGITPHFSRNVRFFDALGEGHDFQISFVKLANNTWAAEVYAADKSEIVTSRADGLIATGTIIFNGDGSLRSVSQGLTEGVDVVWANAAIPSNVTFDWGTPGQVAGTPGATTVGKTDGLRQFNSAYDVQFIDQNGVAPGLLTSITIDQEGFVTASFSNGETRNLFKIPLTTFANPNGLDPLAGNVYRESQSSGSFNLREAGAGGAGKISPAALEQANVELSDELTKMLIAQRGYQASSKVIKTADDLLEELNRVFGG